MFDLAVVGAGPAGSVAAYRAAKKGLHVVLLERASFPRGKVCGSCMNPACAPVLEKAGLGRLLTSLPRSRVSRMELHAGDALAQSALPELPSGREEWGIDRAVLDAALLHEASVAGVVVQERWDLLRLEPEHRPRDAGGNFWRLEPMKGDVVQARCVIGADGRSSRVARLQGLAVGKSRGTWTGWQTSFHAEDRTLEKRGKLPLKEGTVAMYFCEEGYFGIAPVGGGNWNVAMVLRGKVQPGIILQRELGLRLPAVVWKSLAPVERGDHLPCSPHKEGLLLAGDAFRVVEPFTGEGIYFALAGGLLAADEAVHCLGGTAWRETARHYRNELRRLYRGRLPFNAGVRWFCRRPAAASALVTFLQGQESWLQWLASPVIAGRSI